MSGTSGRGLPVPLGFYDPESRSLRTSQATFDWDSTPSSPTLPPSGSMRSGALFARRRSALPISATASSSSPGLPTPAARDWRGGGQKGQLPTAVSLLPTPTVSEATGPGHAADGGMNLRHVVSLLPTPRASANENRQTKRTPSQEAGKHGLSLAAEVCSLLPTPTATPYGTNQSPSPGAAVRPSLNSLAPTLLSMSAAAPPADVVSPSTTQAGSVPAASTAPTPNSVGPSALRTAPTVPVNLLSTPRASDWEKGGPNQRGSKGDLTLPSAAHRIGVSTPPPSPGGSTSSGAPPRAQPTLWDG